MGECYAQDLKSDEKDHALLDQILQQEFKRGAYTVVGPMMYISKLNKDSREYVKQGIKIEGYAIGPIFDQLIQKKYEAGLVDSQVVLGSGRISGQEKETL